MNLPPMSRSNIPALNQFYMGKLKKMKNIPNYGLINRAIEHK